MKKSRELDPALHDVVLHLEEWAEWYCKGLGFGYRSADLTAWVEGSYQRRRSGRYVPSHDRAEAMEQWVVEMGQLHPRMAQVIRVYYFEGGSLRDLALELNISHTQVKYWVDKAHGWLAWRKQR